MNQKVICFDVETGPQPPEVLAKLKPEFKAPKGWKDKAKIAESVAEKEADWLESAALDATTGKVLVVGILEDDKPTYLEGSEKVILEQFWPWLDLQLGAGNIVAGFCIFRFDLVMLYRRAIINGVPVKLNHFRNNNNRYWRGLLESNSPLTSCKAAGLPSVGCNSIFKFWFSNSKNAVLEAASSSGVAIRIESEPSTLVEQPVRITSQVMALDIG